MSDDLTSSQWMDAYERGAKRAIDFLRYRRDHVADGCDDGLENHEKAVHVLVMTQEINILINSLMEDGVIQ